MRNDGGFNNFKKHLAFQFTLTTTVNNDLQKFNEYSLGKIFHSRMFVNSVSNGNYVGRSHNVLWHYTSLTLTMWMLVTVDKCIPFILFDASCGNNDRWDNRYPLRNTLSWSATQILYTSSMLYQRLYFIEYTETL